MADTPEYRMSDSKRGDEDGEAILNADTVESPSVLRSLSTAVSEPASDDVHFPAHAAVTRGVAVASLASSLPTDGAGAGAGSGSSFGFGSAAGPDAEYHARPKFKALPMAPPPSALVRQSTDSGPMMHKGGSAPLPPSTADARPAPGTDSAPATTSAATETLPAAPPLLRPAPFFLVASHFFVAVCALPELMDEISTALKQLEVSFTMKPSSCKFKCSTHVPSGRAVFRVNLYTRKAGDKIAVEVHRRSGSPVLCKQVYRAVMGYLARSRSVERADGTPVAASAAPLRAPSAAAFAPKEVPAALLGPVRQPTADDVKPLEDMLQSDFDDVVQEGARAVASLVATPFGRPVATQAGVLKALVAVLAHPNRSVAARSPAAVALDCATSTPAGIKAIVAAGAVPVMLHHVVLPEACTGEDASKTWHLRRACARAIANVCCCTDADVVAAVKATPGLTETLTAVPSSRDADVAEISARALQGLRIGSV